MEEEGRSGGGVEEWRRRGGVEEEGRSGGGVEEWRRRGGVEEEGRSGGGGEEQEKSTCRNEKKINGILLKMYTGCVRVGPTSNYRLFCHYR